MTSELRASQIVHGVSCAVLFVLAVLLAPAAFAQEEDDGGGIMPPMTRPGRGVEENRIHIPESRDIAVRIGEAEAAEGAGEFGRAARIYLDILRDEREPADGVQMLLKVGENRYVSCARFVRRRLLAFPEEGRAAFRELADSEARALYDEAAARRDLRGLELVWRTFPLAGVAGEALERLGDLAFEMGHLDMAIRRYERAKALPGSTLDPGRLGAKIDAVRAALARAPATAAPAAPAPPAPAESRAGPSRWPVAGGDNAHAAALPPLGRVAAAPRFTVPLPWSRAAQAWGQRVRRLPRFDGQWFTERDDVFPEIGPVAAEGRLILATGNAILCHDLASGERCWYQGLWTGADPNPNLYYSATIAGGRVIAPFIRRVSPPKYYRGIPINEAIAYRRLVAFDLVTGKRLWDQAESADPFLRNPELSIALPPVERDGILYAGAVLREGSLKCYLVAIDARTGRLVWKRFLGAGQVELTMFGEHAIEPLAMQPAESGGTVYHCTAFGAVVAVSALSGEIEWLSTYDTIPIEAARTYYAVPRNLAWRNSPPLLCEGTVVVAPLDARKAFAFDAATGEVRWFVESGGVLRRILGFHQGRVIFQGDRIQAHDIRTGKLALVAPKSLANRGFSEEETGLGLVCGPVALVPFAKRIARIDLTTGEEVEEMPLAGGIRDSGTLLFIGRDLVTVNPQRASVLQLVREKAEPAPAAAAPR